MPDELDSIDAALDRGDISEAEELENEISGEDDLDDDDCD